MPYYANACHALLLALHPQHGVLEPCCVAVPRDDLASEGAARGALDRLRARRAAGAAQDVAHAARCERAARAERERGRAAARAREERGAL